MAEPDELTRKIAQHLEVDHQYMVRVEAWDTERIAEVRSAGPQAGRLLGWKIMTHQTELSEEGRVVVAVVVREWPNQEEHDRLEERGRLIMDHAWPEILPCHQRPKSPPERGKAAELPAPLEYCGPTADLVGR
jgi:hypothetical protein